MDRDVAISMNSALTNIKNILNTLATNTTPATENRAIPAEDQRSVPVEDTEDVEPMTEDPEPEPEPETKSTRTTKGGK